MGGLHESFQVVLEYRSLLPQLYFRFRLGLAFLDAKLDGPE